MTDIFTSTTDAIVAANALLAANSGIQIQSGSVVLNSSGPAAVNLYDGSLSSLGIGGGLLLTTGTTPGTSNTVGWFGADNSVDANGNPINFDNGSTAIDQVVNSVFQTQSFDATTLSFDFTASEPNATSITFDVVFGSDEYPEWVDLFVDCAVVLVNGVNYALFNHDPMSPLSVIGSNLNSGYFQDNAGNTLQIEYDGVSNLLKIVAPIQSGLNHIEIGIADTGDHIYDSGIFISNLSAGSTPGSGVVVEPPNTTENDDSYIGTIQSELVELKSGNDTAYTGGGDDIVVGGAGNDNIYAGSGNDVLEGDAGNDLLDGGEGDANQAVYLGKKDDYSVSYDALAQTYTVQDNIGLDGTDQLSKIQQIKFSDGVYDLVQGVITPHQDNTGNPTNTPGQVAIAGIALVGKTLTAIATDADGITSLSDLTYQWYIAGNPINGATSQTYTLQSSDAGLDVSVSVVYIDAGSHSEANNSATLTIAAVKSGLSIMPMTIEAPEGASVKNPMTTLIQNAMTLGYTPNEAALAIKDVLGVNSSINLATYDPYAALLSTPTDPTALAYLKLSVQVAMTCSVSDPTGYNLTVNIFEAYNAGTLIDLKNTNDLMALGITDTLVQALNLDMYDANNLATVQNVWNDWAGKQDQLKPFLGHLELISVHINQNPTGFADAALPSAIANSPYILEASSLLSGYADPEGMVLSVSQISISQGGDISNNGDGTWTFTPTPDYVGPVEMTYMIADPNGGAVIASQLFAVVPSGNLIYGSSGDDILNSTSGNDTIFGLEGKDTATFQGNKSEYLITDNNDGTWSVADSITSRDGADTLLSIENLQFADQLYTLPIQPTNSAPTFVVGDGVTVTPMGALSAEINLVPYTFTSFQDGKTLLGGSCGGNQGDFALVRYNADGTVDQTFGTDGVVTTDFGYYIERGRSLSIQSDGKILIAGFISNGNDWDFAIARYNIDGTLDTSFSDDGKVITDFGGTSDKAYSINIQPDGKILLAGLSGNTNLTDTDFALVRLNSDGSLDTTFNNDGKVTTDFGTASDSAYSVTIQADDKILVAGNSNNDFALVRYNADGSVDTTFSSDGKVTTSFLPNSTDEANSIAVQEDGKILVSGSCYDPQIGGYEIALVRYNSDGSLDTTFDSDGLVTALFGNGSSYGRSITIQSDGKILLGGQVQGSPHFNFALIRLNIDGSLDTTFNGDGSLVADIGPIGNPDISYSVSVGEDGKILVAGYGSNNGSSYDFTQIRYNRDGSLDLSFNGNNSLDATPVMIENGSGVVLDSNVQIYDAELFMFNSYAGSSLVLSRHGGADSADVFSGAGGVFFELNGAQTSGNLTISDVIIGTFTQVSGTLTINFNSSATQDLVNLALKSISYSNNSDGLASTIQIDWTFNDGNTGDQGLGGGQLITGSTIVSVIQIEDEATADLIINGSPAEGGSLVASLTNVSDLDGAVTSISYQWQELIWGVWYDIASGSTLNIPSNQSYVGKMVHVVSTTTDELGGTTTFTGETLTILNVDDEATGALSVNGAAEEGGQLTAALTNVADLDGSTTTAYQWQENTGTLQSPNWVNIANKTDATLNIPSDQSYVNKSIRVAATTTDSLGGTTTFTSDAQTILNLDDEATGSLNVAGTPAPGQSLLASMTAVSDPDGAVTSTGYVWQLNNGTLLSPNWVDISGAANASYSIPGDASGKMIRVISTTTDTLGGTTQFIGSPITISNNVINGTTGNDTLNGTVGDDTINGLAGNDTITGGSGTDALLGGAGNDIYIITAGSEHPAAEINDTAGTDIIRFTSGTANDTLTLYGLDIGIEQVVIGTAAGVTTGTAALNVNASLVTSALAITGNNGDNQLVGGSAADTLTGGLGNDTLTGGLGNDIMVGGAGNDTYVVDSTADVVTEAASAGTDSIQTSLATFSLGALTNIENLRYTGSSNAILTGNAVANSIMGNAGNDILIGAAGTDSLIGGDGSDLYIMNVTADHSAAEIVENGAAGTDEVRFITTTASTLTLFAGDTGIESVVIGTGTGSSAVSTGTTAININAAAVLNGLTIKGNTGANILTGTTGYSDVMIGGLGNDTYVVNNTGDTVTEDLNAGTDLIQTTLNTYSMASIANVENLTFTGTSGASLTGNGLNNLMTGGAGNDTIDGGAGNDTMVGGAGNDTYVVDSATDVVTEASNAGTDLVQSSISYILGVNVEALTLTGASAINGTGNTLANTITGNDLANIINGLAGADTMIGGGGNDTYVVDNVADSIVESLGGGLDLVQSSVSYTLANYVDNLTLTGTSAINATGNTDNNTLIGNGGANILLGLLGSDNLNGGAGNDRLEGGLGNDTLTGGTGNDNFVFNTAINASSNVDTLTDFKVSGTDKIMLSKAIFAALGSATPTATGVALTATDFVSGTTVTDTSSTGQHLLYNSTSGVLYYDADGSGGNHAVQVALIGVDLHAGLLSTDFLVIA